MIARTCRIASVHREFAGGRRPIVSFECGGSGEPHPRIEDRIQRVDDDVGRNDKEGCDEHNADHDREILHLDRLHDRETETRQTEDRSR